jgi:2-phosphosulfolactate phosphatase
MGHERLALDWGLRGTHNAVERGDAVIIVDVLSFSTTAVIAVHHGAMIYPHPLRAGAHEVAARLGAEAIVGRTARESPGRPTLSPTSFDARVRGKKYVLCSPNGGTCAHAAASAPLALVGAFVNARATMRYVNDYFEAHPGAGVTVIACGETWRELREHESALRPCVEDWLCAGLLLAASRGAVGRAPKDFSPWPGDPISR